MNAPDSLLGDWHARALGIESTIQQAVIGQQRAIRLLLIAVFARGHALLEGDVGVGKTTLLRSCARVIGGNYERVEGSVDMMPGDLIYHTYVDKDGNPRVDPGPLLRGGEALSVFFFNEINRARPQVQALLLRAMAERSVSAFDREFRFPHMVVFADRNRVEKEETFELSSAARDRFMLEIGMSAPTAPEVRAALVFEPRFHDVDALIDSMPAALVDHTQLNGIAATIQASVQASEALRRYALDLWSATLSPATYGVTVSDIDPKRLVLAGASPRGMSMLLRAARVAAWLDGRGYLVPDDLQSVFREAMTHRVFFTPVYEMRRAEIAPVFIDSVLSRVAAP